MKDEEELVPRLMMATRNKMSLQTIAGLSLLYSNREPFGSFFFAICHAGAYYSFMSDTVQQIKDTSSRAKLTTWHVSSTFLYE